MEFQFSLPFPHKKNHHEKQNTSRHEKTTKCINYTISFHCLLFPSLMISPIYFSVAKRRFTVARKRQAGRRNRYN